MEECLECGHELIGGNCLLHGTKYQIIAHHISKYGNKSPLLKALYKRYSEQQKLFKSSVLNYKTWYQNRIDECITRGALIPK